MISETAKPQQIKTAVAAPIVQADVEPLIERNEQLRPTARLKKAVAQAEAALAGDSNDAEHDALLALMESLSDLLREGSSTSADDCFVRPSGPK